MMEIRVNSCFNKLREMIYKKYTWEQTASKTLESYKKTFDKNQVLFYSLKIGFKNGTQIVAICSMNVRITAENMEIFVNIN